MSVKSDLARLHQIGAAAVRHGFGHQLSRLRVFSRLGFASSSSQAEHADSAAKRLCSMLEELGPTFVKLGQILSTRPDVLPPEFIAELSRLRDNVPPMPFDCVRQAIADGLGVAVEERFSSLSPKPLASASIAQVHAAVLLDGTDVVVKVQRPGIGGQMATDAELIRKVARLFELVFEEWGSYGQVAVVEEWQKGLALELDFENEARAILAFYAANKDREHVKIPKLYQEYSSKTVLTMERLIGRRLSDINDDERSPVAQNLVRCALQQVFEDGLFHADPHPGNFLVLENGAIGVLDFGLVGRLTKDSQDSLIALAISIALSDADTAARLIYRIGNPPDRIPLAKFRSEMRQMLDRYLGLRLEQVHSKELAREILDLMSRYRMRIPREFALLAKTTITFEGVLRELQPDLDLKQTLLPYAEQLLLERHDPRQLKGGSLKLLLQVAGFLQDLPLQISQALLDFETGKTTIRVEGSGLEGVAKALRGVGVAILAGSVTLAGVIAAILSVGSSQQIIWGAPIGLVVGLACALLATLSASIYVLCGGLFPRLRWRKKGSHEGSRRS